MDGTRSGNDSNFSKERGLRQQLTSLYEEHADLDKTIEHLVRTPPDDDLLIRRLKKRKLLLKDRIKQLEQSLNLDPDEYA